MADTELAQVLSALATAQVRYIVVGGVAIVLHGHLRFTADLDIILSLEPRNVRAALSALRSLGFQPRAPVSAEQFADPDVRRAWATEKNMRVFSLWSPSAPTMGVDIFVDEPLPFEDAFGRSVVADVGGTEIRVASIADMIALKKAAGRPKDLEDIAALLAIADALEGEKSRDG